MIDQPLSIFYAVFTLVIIVFIIMTWGDGDDDIDDDNIALGI